VRRGFGDGCESCRHLCGNIVGTEANAKIFRVLLKNISISPVRWQASLSGDSLCSLSIYQLAHEGLAPIAKHSMKNYDGFEHHL